MNYKFNEGIEDVTIKEEWRNKVEINGIQSFPSHDGKENYLVNSPLFKILNLENKIFCTECDSSFQFSKDLLLHMESIHERKIPFHCTVCKQIFPQQVGLSEHNCLNTFEVSNYNNWIMPTSTKYKIEIFRCAVCAIGFESANELINHVITVHDDENQAQDGNTAFNER